MSGKHRAPLWIAAAAAAGLATLIVRRRARGYAALDPRLRSPRWRVRSPSIGPAALRLARMVPATACVEGVASRVERIASAGGATVAIHVYRPDGVADGGAAMLYTHGGGLILGSAEAFNATVSAYARDLGIVVVSTDYRLAPEHPFPAALDDVHAAYHWLHGNAAALGVDAGRIIVAGDSAGGGITAALCQRLRDEGAPPPVFQLLIYPMLDDRTTLRPAPPGRGELVWTEASNLFGWSSYLGRRPVRDHAPAYAAPARTADLAGLPPAWIGVGMLDLFYDEDMTYAQRLEQAGVPCRTVIVPGAFHGFDVVTDTEVGRSFRDRILEAARDAAGG